ncbi:sensor histidine kinase [Nocardioides terrisoli]|uniref:sensor histidine kinase n=1 Tax=Nocardioides terrisoli TaxID=3388267 RepID=UPI00287BB6A3|nr:HAMP domain-containing sensor histidine kinase [Nocardioides marmorisolisilvae]
MIAGRSLRQLQLGLVVAAAGLIVVVGGAGTLSAVYATKTVNHLSESVNPAVQANANTYQDMLTGQAAVRAFAISGTRSSIADYRRAVGRLRADGRALAQFGSPGSKIRGLYVQQRAAERSWIREYAEPRIARGGGPGTYQAPLFDKGVRLFAEVEHIHAALGSRLDAEYTRARDDAQTRLNATLALIATLTVIGGAVIALLGWWVTEVVRRPLASLTDVVDRLARGDHAARAQVEGPPEIRQVSRALNGLADESDRGRDVEAAIQRQLREVDAAKSGFVSNVSHELRTPLTIITGYLELLIDELAGSIDEEQARMLGATERNVQRLRDLIEDLLALDRAEHSGVTAAPIDLRTSVDVVASDLRLSASNRGIRIDVELPAEPVIVMADAAQIQRALLNVLNNAVKFSHEGGDIEVCVVPGNENVLVTVTDYGIGIPRGEISKLGSRFFRASNAVRSEIAGTGLGLRVVQTIIANHFGTVSLNSSEGAGTEVRITLPLRPPAGADVEPTAGNNPPGHDVV